MKHAREWLRPTRRFAAAIGALLLTSLIFASDSPIADGLAFLALVALVLASVVATLEVATVQVALRDRPAFRHSWPAPRHTWAVSAAIVLVASALVVQTWFQTDTVIAGGDASPPAGSALINRLLTPWLWSGSDLGSPGSLEVQLPWATLLSVVHALGGGSDLAQRLWLTALFCGTSVSCLVFLGLLGARPLAAGIGAAVYVLNPYDVSVIGTNPVLLCSLFLLVFLSSVVLAAARGLLSLPIAVVLVAASAPFVGYAYENPPLVGMVLFVQLVLPFVAGWLWGIHAFRRTALVTGMGLTLLAVASAYWVVPAIIALHGTAISQLSAPASWTWTEARSTLANAFWLNTSWAWDHAEYYPYAPVYSSLPLLALKFLLPAAAFSSLWFTGRRSHDYERDPTDIGLRVIASASLAALAVIFVSTGTRPPGNWLFDAMYQRPFGWLLREPGRFLMLAALAYAVLLAAFVSKLGGSGIRIPQLRASSHPLLAGLAGAALAIGPGFPIVTGQIVPEANSSLPSAHVHVPQYWLDMAQSIDRQPYSGAVLILPPDDFYQMPYQWGYYGTDGFIPNLVSRSVILPSGQGYFQPTPGLMDATDEAVNSMLTGDWSTVQRILTVLRSPLVLVRGDIDAAYPGRTIIEPRAIASALERSSAFKLIDQKGPLRLYVNEHAARPDLEATPFATVDSSVPDLRTLSLLASDTNLVSSAPMSGVTRINQLPSLVSWPVVENELQMSVFQSAGWRYSIGILQTGQPARAVDSPAQLHAVSPFAASLTSDPGRTGSKLTIQLPLNRNGVDNGDFSQGPWQADVGDCNALAPSQDLAGLAADVIGDGPGGASALRLSARADSACEATPIHWTAGSVLVRYEARHVSGAPPRICIWEAGPNQCASTPSPTQIGWTQYSYVVTPPADTKYLSLYLYSDGLSGLKETVNDYANVAVYTIPDVDLVLLGIPTSAPSESMRLWVLHESYSADWAGPRKHVVVDGMINGWIAAPSNGPPAISYRQADPISVALRLSCAAYAVIATILVVTLLRVHARRERARRARRN